ncbi:MAG: toprim domain-containing protein, partial [Saccharofermentanaceae bacterium]
KVICPACSHTHSDHNLKNRDVSWSASEKVGNCKRCGEVFFVPMEKEKNKIYTKPIWRNTTELDVKIVKYFESRKISQFVLRNNNLVSSGNEYMFGENKMTIQFNYWRDEELINIKYRTSDKRFKLISGAELIYYNINSLKLSNEAIITEGEFDCLSLIEAGFKNVISVPNGAGASLEFIDNCFENFIGIEKIIIAGDQDEPGIKLRDELARRLGIERCYKVNFEDCKDANEYLAKYGCEKLRQVINTCEPFPIEGIFSTNDIKDELENIYFNGLPSGETVGIKQLDELITWQAGRVYTVTGIPSHGKSEFIDWILTRLNVLRSWKPAYFSPENYPIELHASKIIEKITGKQCKPNNLSKTEFDDCVKYMGENFYFIMPEEDFTLDSILLKAGILVSRKGINVLVIDPYNKLEHKIPSGTSETNYVSLFYDKLCIFARKKNIVIILVAHPTKMKKDATGKFEIPTLYDISGSANFYNKTDFGITIYRDFNEELIQIFIQKVKFKHLGKTGSCNFKYNINNGRFEYYDGYNLIWNNESYFKKSEQKDVPVNLSFYETDKEDAPF